MSRYLLLRAPRTPVRLATRSYGFFWRGLLGIVLVLSAGCTERRQVQLVEESDSKLANGAYSDAVEVLRRAVSLHPESRTSVKALYKLGFIQETYLRDVEGALFSYNEFVRLSTDPVAVYEVRKRVAALYFDQTDEIEKAAEAYQKLLQSSPDSLEADYFQFRLGQAYFRQNEFEKARQEYQALVDKYPKSHFVARGRFEIGNSYYMEGKYEIAVEALKQVLRYHAQSEYSVEAEFLTAQCYEHLDRFPAAIQVYEAIRGRYSPTEVIDLRMAEIRKRSKKAK